MPYMIKIFIKIKNFGLIIGGKAAIQFYPEDEDQIEQISNAAIKSGFSGGLFVDYPNSSTAKKYYLVLTNVVEGKLKGKFSGLYWVTSAEKMAV